MKTKTEEELKKMYDTEKTILVRSNELDYDTVQGILENLDTTEEELLARCFQVGLYIITEEFVKERTNDHFISDIAKALDGDGI